jgi:hypothetical protein
MSGLVHSYFFIIKEHSMSEACDECEIGIDDVYEYDDKVLCRECYDNQMLLDERHKIEEQYDELGEYSD